MTETIYHNFPINVRGIIISRWKDYKDTFGFETDLYKKLESEGLTQEQIEAKVAERRTLIKELWRQQK